MNRNTRTLIVLAVAVLMAGIASFGVYLAVRSMPVREVEIARAQAVVAARPLMVGTMVTKDDVKTRAVAGGQQGARARSPKSSAS